MVERERGRAFLRFSVLDLVSAFFFTPCSIFSQPTYCHVMSSAQMCKLSWQLGHHLSHSFRLRLRQDANGSCNQPILAKASVGTHIFQRRCVPFRHGYSTSRTVIIIPLRNYPRIILGCCSNSEWRRHRSQTAARSMHSTYFSMQLTQVPKAMELVLVAPSTATQFFADRSFFTRYCSWMGYACWYIDTLYLLYLMNVMRDLVHFR